MTAARGAPPRLQVDGVEALGEPVVDGREKSASIVNPAGIAPHAAMLIAARSSQDLARPRRATRALPQTASRLDHIRHLPAEVVAPLDPMHLGHVEAFVVLPGPLQRLLQCTKRVLELAD